MNLDQIATRISEPASCLQQEIPALKELTEKYPYAQIFSILYLKALSNHHDIGFEEALQKHAYRISDRMKLYDLIQGIETNENLPTSKPEIIENEPAIQLHEKIKPVENAIQATQEEVIAIDSELEEVEILKKNEVDEIPESAEISESMLTTDLVEIIEPKITTEEVLENEILNTENEVVELEIESNSDFKLQEEQLNLDIISEVVSNVYTENIEIEALEEEKIEVDEKISEQIEPEISTIQTEDIQTKRSFTSWLKMGEVSTNPVEPKKKEHKEEDIEIIEKQIDKIINKFIEKEPSISRPQKEFYSPSKKAKESINPDSLIYTETLANIFAIQGNFPKAIVAYEQLMLTIPEKKVFFANRIEELKEKLK